MKKAFSTLGLCIALVGFTSQAKAQGEIATSPGGANSLTDGANSLSFGIPNGGNGYASGTAGYWMMVGPDMNLGLNIGLALDTGGEETVYDLLLAPVLKMYMHTDGVVAPYWYGQLNFQINDNGVDSDNALSLAGGLGVEWFITQVFSVAGQVGVGVDIIRAGDVDPFSLGTFTSGLTAQIYFE